MELYLMQHGQAVPESADPEQPLSKEGAAQIQATAAALKRLGVAFDLILCSPKKRARQSAALIAEGVNYPFSDIVETEKLKPKAPADEALTFLRSQAANRSVLIAGHLPSLANLAARLLGGDAPVRIRFENGGLCRIDTGDLGSGQGELVSHLPAALLQLLGRR